MESNGVGSAVTAAVKARPGWRTTSASERAHALRAAAERVRAEAPSLGELLCATTGRLRTEATASALVAADLLDEAAVTGLAGTGRSLPGEPSAIDFVKTEPRGVVGVLTPWNDPYPAAAGLIAAALVTGNTVVHKPSERSAEPGRALARCIAEQLPPGVLELVEGDGAVGALIADDSRVDVVGHIGSTATGRSIGAAVGRRGGRVVLENGGNDALIVDEGVDPAWAAEQIAVGAFTNAGQLCTSVERVYIHKTAAEAVVAQLVARAELLRAGDPTDERTTLARLIDEKQLTVVAHHVDDAQARGATCLTGGGRWTEDGLWFRPTVLTGCTSDMAVMREETFGPIAPLTVVSSFDEGLELAGAGDYGLCATVLTPDMENALRAVAELEVGTVKVNAVFGGAPSGSADPRRGSGSGCGFGPDLLRELTALKAVHLESVAPPRQ